MRRGWEGEGRKGVRWLGGGRRESERRFGRAGCLGFSGL